MQPNLSSDLITYTLTDEELLQSHFLTLTQKASLQNERVAITKQLAYLTPDDLTEKGKGDYWQQEAYLRGQLDIITNLLDKSTAAETAIAASKEF